MKPEYEVWIEAYVSSHNNRYVRGTCAEAATKMVKAFPELRKAAGFAHVGWGREQHWWCVDPDGNVIDPTAEQYATCGIFRYEELDLNDPKTRERVPSGRCMCCGDDVYMGRTFCSLRCERSFCADLGVPSNGKESDYPPPPDDDFNIDDDPDEENG